MVVSQRRLAHSVYRKWMFSSSFVEAQLREYPNSRLCVTLLFQLHHSDQYTMVVRLWYHSIRLGRRIVHARRVVLFPD
jgi:hypothetical protein